MHDPYRLGRLLLSLGDERFFLVTLTSWRLLRQTAYVISVRILSTRSKRYDGIKTCTPSVTRVTACFSSELLRCVHGALQITYLNRCGYLCDGVSSFEGELFPIKCETDTSSASWQSSFELTLTSDDLESFKLRFFFEAKEEAVCKHIHSTDILKDSS
jgi:hypothetical protein